MSITNDALRLYLADALEPAEAAAVAERLQADPALQSRLAELAARGPVPVPVPSRWRVPPPGFGWPGRGARPGTLSDQHVRVGRVFRMLIDPLPDAEARDVVLLRREGEAWAVQSPRAPEQRVRVAELPRDGVQHCVDAVAQPPAGPQRWAVAMPEARLLDAGWDPSWAALKAAISGGAVPLTAMDIDVEP